MDSLMKILLDNTTLISIDLRGNPGFNEFFKNSIFECLLRNIESLKILDNENNPNTLNNQFSKDSSNNQNKIKNNG